MPAYYETQNYAFNLHRVGASITRKSDNTSVYFQPGDATQDAVEAVGNALTHDNPTPWFEMWCDEFTDHFAAHAIARTRA